MIAARRDAFSPYPRPCSLSTIDGSGLICLFSEEEHSCCNPAVSKAFTAQSMNPNAVSPSNSLRQQAANSIISRIRCFVIVSPSDNVSVVTQSRTAWQIASKFPLLGETPSRRQDSNGTKSADGEFASLP